MRMQLAILRMAGLLVPRRQRAEWFAEWRSELWHVRRVCRGRATRFCLGAFPDALWFRRNDPPSTRQALCLGSPIQCCAFLAVLAGLSVFFAIRLPVPRALLFPSPYPDAKNLAMVSLVRPFNSVSLEQFHALANRREFRAVAFYRPVRAELDLAIASGNLFEVLGVPTASNGLILSQRAWRKSFHSDPHIVGRVIPIAGRRAVVAGVLPSGSWRLPGRVDAWLLDGDLPPQSKGFVVARFRTHPQHIPGFDCSPLTGPPILAFIGVIGMSLLILPVSTPLSLGEYPANHHSPPWTTRLRRWIFLGLKFALVLPIVFCGSLDLLSTIAMGIQPHGLLIFCIFGFRWVLMDQRRRCPVCLRLLTNPAQIGRSSQTFLEWYGTELMCTRGHGLLHVPEIKTSCYSTQRWMYLDPSWSGLFG